ncbi:MAG TPA: 3-carboxy-cis,cis-muconate cycloisomerase [Solirubrobacteraceae bacterium]|nr:3-carboxy-cis,cis-muconate cycloisomerase [Solirubrobacteraceae bacterium]
MPEPGLFDGVLARGAVRPEVDDVAWLQAMLDVEAALARAQGSAHAAEIAGACQAELFDPGRLGADAALTANPVVPLVQGLRERVGPAAAADVHRGATSQDVLDSAAMLVARRALGALLEDLRAAADAAAALAAGHRETPISGRTLLQPAVPTTFGLKAAGWVTALDEAAARLEAVRSERLAVQLGGAAGTLAAMGDAGTDVLAALAQDLGLAEPVLPWHTDRTRIAELAGALGEAAGVAAKAARDVVLLAQSEVGEVREGGDPRRGGSSAMPHKRNPVAAVSALACALQAPGLVATLLAAMAGEHERAAGAWQSEWQPLSDLLRLTGSAAAWVRDCLEHLEVDAARMRSNLDAVVATVGDGEQFDLGQAVPAAAALVDRALAARPAATARAPSGGA